MKTDEAVIYYGDLLYSIGGQYYCKSGLGRFVDELCGRYKRVFFCAPVKDENSSNFTHLYRISADNLIIQPLPPCGSFISAMLNRRHMLSAIRKHSVQWNSPVYIRWPTPLVKDVYNVCRRRSLPVTLHIVGDARAIISESGKYKGVLKALAMMYIAKNEKSIKKIMRNVTTLVNGSGMRRLYLEESGLKVKEIRSATLTESELFQGKKVLNKEKIKILYVGVLKKEKGLDYLIEALPMIRLKGYEVSLSIIGDGPEMRHLRDRSRELNLQDCVSFEGYVPLGPKLLNSYRTHDIFVLPSVSEGTPRVLIEAMANRLLVISTDVGGVPYTIQHGINGLLVRPKDPNAIAHEVIHVIEDDEVRTSIVDNGFKFAKENTLEHFVDEVVSEMSWQKNRSSN